MRREGPGIDFRITYLILFFWTKLSYHDWLLVNDVNQLLIFSTLNIRKTCMIACSQDEVYDEIYNVVGDSDRDLTPEDTAKFAYLEQVIKETLRMYPTISVFTRQLMEDIKVSEYSTFVTRFTSVIYLSI